jgi:hypothetical protein
MTIMRITRYTTDPADVPAMLARRDALVAAVRVAHPGMRDASLGRVDERTWLDLWRWESRVQLEAAVADTPNIPEAAAAFALTSDVTVEVADLLDA